MSKPPGRKPEGKAPKVNLGADVTPECFEAVNEEAKKRNTSKNKLVEKAIWKEIGE